jgi:hypothetical protein
MRNGDEAELNLNRHFEDVLRKAMPGVHPPDDHRRILSVVLRNNFTLKRRPYLKPVIGLTIVALCLAAWSLTELGSGDFSLFLSKEDDQGVREYSHKTDNTMFITADSTIRQDTLETVNQLTASKQGTLQKVLGLTVRGRTKITLSYEYEVEGRSVLIGWSASQPGYETTSDHLEFLKTHGHEIKKGKADGSAEYIGTENIFIDGAPVTLHKWRAKFPEWGPVIYLEGVPSPSSISKN